MSRLTYAQRLAEAVSRYEPCDQTSLLAFRQSALGAHAPQAEASYFRWQSEKNPELDGGGAPVWFLRHDGRIIGQLSAIPVALQVMREVHRASWGVDLIVEDALRGRGVGTALCNACVAEYGLTLGAAVSADARKALSRSGWKDLGTLPLFVRPLQGTETLLSSVLPRASVVLGASIDRVIRAADGVAGKAISAWTGTHFEEVSRFDDRVDALWASVSPDYEVVARRDQRTLNWRYADHPEPGRYRMVSALKGDQLVGYAVVRVGRWRDQLGGYIIDFLASLNHITALLVECLRVLREAGARWVLCWQTHRTLHSILKLLGFIRRPSGCALLVRVGAASETHAQVLLDRGRWYLTAGDSDIDRPRVEER